MDSNVKNKRTIYDKYIKRVLDFSMAFIACIVLWPIMLIVAVLIKIKLGGPIIFKQQRLGKDNKTFNIYKFRTMTNETDENGELLPVEIRLTNFGKILRATSLDELPELFNIMKGEMSLIGPRPLPSYYLNYYTEEEKHRHDVRPGLTGLAQVNGRNYVSWEEKFAMDLSYVNNVSFINDIRVILKTVQVVLKSENIEVGSYIEHNGKIYRPLNIERQS